jgi:outer membrane lipoprotein carrier protein
MRQRIAISRVASVAFCVAITLSAIGVGQSLASGDGDLKQALSALQRHYQETKSFSAKFTEEIAPVGSPKRTRSGIVYFEKPGRMRWEFDEPSKELIVSDGTQLYNYDPDLNQVVEAPLAEALHSPGATEFLLGVGDVGKEFDASIIANKPADGLTHIRLTPKSGGNIVELGLASTNGDIQTIRVIDQLGDITSVKLSQIVNNSPLSASLFTFMPPAGADIVKPTQPK